MDGNADHQPRVRHGALNAIPPTRITAATRQAIQAATRLPLVFVERGLDCVLDVFSEAFVTSPAERDLLGTTVHSLANAQPQHFAATIWLECGPTHSYDRCRERGRSAEEPVRVETLVQLNEAYGVAHCRKENRGEVVYNASDARIQAMGRWLNPDSVKLYARTTKLEYATWVDRILSVRRIDTARTTSLPIMDAADAFAQWGDQLKVVGANTLERWDTPGTDSSVMPSPLKRGERLYVYWTDDNEWYPGTFVTSRIEDADGGGRQRSSCILYDAVGAWASCTKAQLTYWHCLDDKLWKQNVND